MKASNHFKNTIQAYLDQRAETDVLFSFQYTKPEKNIDDCITCILNTVQKSGCNGFADDEIYSMAMHYYDTENINIGNPINCNVVVNHVVEEKAEAHKEAVQRVQDEAYNRIKQQPKKRTKQSEEVKQLTLF
jgi:hypothetical protein